MRKTIAAKAALAVLLAAALLVMNFLLFQIYVGAKLDLKETYIAAHDIMPRTKISEDDLIAVKIPERYLQNLACNDKSRIIGRYTEIQGMIPAGSPFYESMLYDESEIPDHAGAQLRENQVSFTLEVDVTSVSNMSAGQRADIFVTINPRSDNPVTGCLLRNVRIIDIRDHRGISLSSPESNHVPYIAELAVNSAHLELLSMAKTAGTIQLYMSADSYNTDNEAYLDETSPVTAYLINLLHPVSDDTESPAD
ncbi:MAG: hypothetical protein E7194_11565 [Erysipelotrichaceae bacterium]|nr:hypothetical protein [Erysipelotrichaceae bacterium]